MSHDLALLSAVDAVEVIRTGRATSEALTAACLARIEASEPQLKAWAHLDPEAALIQAREADRIRRAGRATGALHGVPVGLKDIVETCDMPTQCGTPFHEGRRTERDARIVERLREAGAVIMGKTATTEFAYMHPASTTNPKDASRTPGGSSSGSAAAVAARHVPLAVGTQTGGSVIRPASFCGTYGFKPTRGTISRSGVFQTSAALDQIGGFANSLEDIALLTDVIGCYDQDDKASFARPRPSCASGVRADVPAAPDLVWFEMPFHDRLDPDAAEGLEAVIDALGARVERVPPSPHLIDLVTVHKTIYDYEFARNMAALADTHGAQLSLEMRDAFARSAKISDAEYEDAMSVKASADAFFAAFFNDYDAILAPSSTGEAPLLSAGHTGDSVFCTTWTLAGLPCLTLPLLVGENDLPIGVQLIGAVEEDDRLMRTAAWMQRHLSTTETGEM